MGGYKWEHAAVADSNVPASLFEYSSHLIILRISFLSNHVSVTFAHTRIGIHPLYLHSVHQLSSNSLIEIFYSLSFLFCIY